MPAGKWLTLGLISAKLAEPEEPDTLCRRIDEAARYMPLDRLAISPACGFSPSILAGGLNQADQAAKLRLLTAVANKIWG